MPISRDIVAFIRNNRRDRPDQILLDELFNFKSEDLHITEKLKKEHNNESIFAPIRAVSTFLKYPSLYEFNADFSLWKNIDDLSSYGTNMVEETLKSIVAKNASLFSLFLWAWGAFKAITIFDEEEVARGNKLFRLALTKTISSYKETKRSTKKASSGDWDPFVRYSSAWAKKSEDGFRDTLSAYIEMFQVLFYNLNSEKASIKRVEISKDNLRFFLDIDGDNLVHRLNTVHQDLIEVFNGQTFYDRHQTSRKILKYWLLSQVSDIDGKDKKEADKNQWGSDSGFYIQNRNSENSTGITITFSL